MTRKDYVRLASLIRHHLIPLIKADTNLGVSTFLERLTTWMKRENPSFSKEKFLEACYIE